MAKIAKNIISILVVGSTSLLLAACYGPPMYLKSISAKARDKLSGNPVKGLSLELVSASGEAVFGTASDENGAAQLIYDSRRNDSASLTLRARDVDGADNGGPYKEASAALGKADSIVFDMEKAAP